MCYSNIAFEIEFQSPFCSKNATELPFTYNSNISRATWAWCFVRFNINFVINLSQLHFINHWWLEEYKKCLHCVEIAIELIVIWINEHSFFKYGFSNRCTIKWQIIIKHLDCEKSLHWNCVYKIVYIYMTRYEKVYNDGVCVCSVFQLKSYGKFSITRTMFYSSYCFVNAIHSMVNSIFNVANVSVDWTELNWTECVCMCDNDCVQCILGIWQSFTTTSAQMSLLIVRSAKFLSFFHNSLQVSHTLHSMSWQTPLGDNRKTQTDAQRKN